MVTAGAFETTAVKRGAPALLVSCALHAAVVSGLLLVPLRDEIRSVRAVLPVQLVEATADDSTPPKLFRPVPSRVVPVARRAPKVEDAASPRPSPQSAEASNTAAAEEPVQKAETASVVEGRSEDPHQSATTAAVTQVSASNEWFSLSADIGTVGAPQSSVPQTAARAFDVAAVPSSGAVVSPSVAPRITELARPGGGYQIRPIYPPAARRAGAEGTTLLKVYVQTNGNIGEVRVERSAGHAALDQAAADAVSKWHFQPARSGSEPVATWVLIPVEFRIQR